MKETNDFCDYLPAFSDSVASVWGWFEHASLVIWSGLGWPHAVLIMFVIAICIFRSELKSVIPRIKKLGTDGFELDSMPPPQFTAGSNIPQLPPMADFPNATTVVLGFLDRELSNVSEEALVEYLRKDAVGWRVLCYFENTYGQIYGGQIQLLKTLNSRGDAGMPMSEFMEEWADYKERFKPNLDNWVAEPFLAFLTARSLIENTGDKLTISIIGKEFMVWMAKFGRPELRMW